MGTADKSNEITAILELLATRNMASLRKITLNLARLAQNRQPKKAQLEEHP
ncbi:hypothetical protein [Burkholderia sp. BDU5]|uniref:hypothetical protein n=1 Tax=Burkholderia sp. BDU5 TaxID=1385590 RepID=UPI001E51E9F4|nr:hypothetical protein [Burkholderia sp. BDU5]